ncbi:Mitochondrial-processing peptidase subunit alpha [Hordeum vulgare]|nr:Mitochondrial-processing peptidase subunit alpha [Hordeum vulgare]
MQTGSRPFWVVAAAACFPGKGLHSRLNPLVNEFDQIISISAFKDVHDNTVIFGIHTSTVVDQTQLDCAKSSVKSAISANLESKVSIMGSGYKEDVGKIIFWVVISPMLVSLSWMDGHMEVIN